MIDPSLSTGILTHLSFALGVDANARPIVKVDINDRPVAKFDVTMWHSYH